MTKYIIGTIQGLDLPLTPSMKEEKSAEHYIRNITYDDLKKERIEVLNTKPEDIQKYADLIAELMKKNYFCVLGNESKIKENKEIFGKLVNVFE
jgi:Predicted Zn-dependent peptidases, insulinase-like